MTKRDAAKDAVIEAAREILEWLERNNLNYTAHSKNLFDALTRYNAAPADDDGWRPIETAPKDGTRFLFRTRQGFVSVGFYIGRNPVFAADSFGGERDTDPCLWRPLPAPLPAPRDGENE